MKCGWLPMLNKNGIQILDIRLDKKMNSKKILYYCGTFSIAFIAIWNPVDATLNNVLSFKDEK